MKRLLFLLAILWLFSPSVRAQQWTPGGQGIPIVCAFNSSPPAVGTGLFVYAQCNSAGTLLTSGGGGGGTLPSNTTATDCSGTITTGNTAQNAITASTSHHGFIIANIDTSEPLWFSMTTTATVNAIQSYPLSAATPTTFTGLTSFSENFGFNGNLSVVAATTGHKFSCTQW